jgi:hypothetical protein
MSVEFVAQTCGLLVTAVAVAFMVGVLLAPRSKG